MLSIYNNLSAGAQNVTGAYIIIMLVYRRLLTTRLHGKAAVCIIQGYHLEVHNVIKYTRVHAKTLCHCNIMCKPGFV